MNEHYPHIRLYSGDNEERMLSLREGVNVTFYMNRSHQEVLREVLTALDTYSREVQPHRLDWYFNPRRSDWDRLDAKAWPGIHRRVLEEPAASLWLREDPKEMTGYEFFHEGLLLESHTDRSVSAVSFSLPTEYLEAQGPDRVRQLTLDLAAKLPFHSGHAGLAFHFAKNMPSRLEAIQAWSSRHPGLDIPDVHSTARSLGTRINGVHWLNFLGPSVLDELRGPAGLRARLHSPDTTVQELDGGRALVTLGTWPDAGDLEQGRTLPAYRELARVLEPWLYLDPDGWSGFFDEDVRRWHRRFLD
jgi:hypothetical protein